MVIREPGQNRIYVSLYVGGSGGECPIVRNRDTLGRSRRGRSVRRVLPVHSNAFSYVWSYSAWAGELRYDCALYSAHLLCGSGRYIGNLAPSASAEIDGTRAAAGRTLDQGVAIDSYLL